MITAKRIISLILCICCISIFSACSKAKQNGNSSAGVGTVSLAETSQMDFSFEQSDTTAPLASDYVTDISQATLQNSNNEIQTYSITSGGTYTLTGERNNVMLLVDAKDAEVTVILSGVTISNANAPAIYVRSANKVTLSLAEGTVNTFSDGSLYKITDSDSTLDAAVFSKADLTVNGSGELNVTGNYKHGIVSKDDLIVCSGTVYVSAKSAALCGKDCVKIHNGTITLSAGSDGIRSDNGEDASKGYIYLLGGSLDITAANDGIQAQTVLKIENVNLTVNAGGGSANMLSSSDESYKGLKAGSDIYITGGTFEINSMDDCIHSNGTITVSGGKYTLSSGDDGIHADTDLQISGANTEITVCKSYEGIEATNIIINEGNIAVTANDDGLNAAGGNNSTGSGFSRPGQNNFSASTGSIVISGGTLYIKMSGDGIDANGSLDITGGNITVSGANRGDTAILDFDTYGTVGGGTFIGTGASGMAQNFSSTSTQGVIFTTCSTNSANTQITLTDSSGREILKHIAEQDFSCVILSHPDIKQGQTYTLAIGSEKIAVSMNDTVYSSQHTGGMGGNRGFGKRPF